ncbi:hypothetical protein ACFQ1E_11935 [Sphingomonas canadensis]|uniref:DUF2207 domain-containing protein n=1 Tax=Sphingomonas canadensis TaxID=1219257 RepID=A0ABW3H8L5_9SPHN|nr:hypothetical protein [Sphingomonas canadensis]MCW3836816.1 hypothetical protein [Sphingomonas canadensis]
MNRDTQATIITILAIIGGLVVLGWVLKLTLHLMGPLLLIAIGVAVYLLFFKKGGR